MGKIVLTLSLMTLLMLVVSGLSARDSQMGEPRNTNELIVTCEQSNGDCEFGAYILEPGEEVPYWSTCHCSHEGGGGTVGWGDGLLDAEDDVSEELLEEMCTEHLLDFCGPPEADGCSVTSIGGNSPSSWTLLGRLLHVFG